MILSSAIFGCGGSGKTATGKKIVICLLSCLARVHTFFAGCLYCSVTRVKADYSVWLGPDYVYRYDRVGIHVCNHLHMYDIIHGMYLQLHGGFGASFIGKRELTNVPLLGLLVLPLDTILVGRDTKDSKEQRNAVV